MADSDALLSDLCSICHVNPPKYRCPRCSTRTCSLPCTRRHKLWSQCSGVRDPAAYLKRKELSTESAFDRDFNFITGIERGLERADRDADNRGIDLSREIQGEDIGDDSQDLNTGLKRKYPHRGLVKGEAGFLRAAEAAGVQVIRAPKGMSRNKQNASRLHPKHKYLAWTVEWVASDGSKTVRNAIADTCTISEAYDRSIPRSKDQNTSTSDEEAKDDHKNSDMNNAESEVIPTPTDSTTVTGEPGASEAHEAAVPESKVLPAEISTNVVQQPLDKSNTHRDLYFYLLRPRTSTKNPVLAPLSPSSTLNEVLRSRAVLEFPTIFALSVSPETLAGQETSPFMLEEEYLRTAGPEEIGKSTRIDEDVAGNETLPASAVNLQDVDEERVLEVLKQDLFEEVPVTEPTV
ncbi:uncharacterized protein N7511_008741 [Penicillium nucicola]|uniref:uncharacterized protein n=1 Tax=Penicillium nucicola TaxID=1850975 RepID=UPI00254592DD|nr:uncharacterized protein N7511_008741 [Penicillium nucicola]KAJ5747045.1 hypothetical protein N7511_008741 [Penicillium nucicola]